MERLKILNTMVDNCTMDEAVAEIEKMIARRANAYVVTPNLDHLLSLDTDKEFEKAYRNADMILADGISMILLAKYLHLPLKEKVSGSDLFPRVCEMAAKHGYSLFILGAAPGVAEAAGKNLAARYKGLVIAGTYSPSFGFEKDSEEIERMIHRVKSCGPSILAIALGDRKGEKFICQYREQLGVPVTLSIGAAVDFEAGNKKRAPHWVSQLGFEWLFRMIQEPKRIGKRVLRDIKGLIPLVRKYR